MSWFKVPGPQLRRQPGEPPRAAARRIGGLALYGLAMGHCGEAMDRLLKAGERPEPGEPESLDRTS